MILADKIMTLRKKTGWSQEELAAQLNVSRQSVSKWEGAQSIPDMDKVVQMSRLFGVTTDFLLKDELEMEEHTQSTPIDEPPLRRVTMEEASAYLALRREAAPKMALATCLCILSPVALLMLAAMSEFARFGISENAAAGIGLCVLLVLVAIGVALFLTCAAKVRDAKLYKGRKQTVKRAADNKRRYAPGEGSIPPVLLSGVSKGVPPLAHDFACKV